ncbi:MAG: hypothetical protein ACYS17_05625 [Planctomycetota bacterium]
MKRRNSHLLSTEGLKIQAGWFFCEQKIFSTHQLLHSPKHESLAQLRRNPPMNVISR